MFAAAQTLGETFLPMTRFFNTDIADLAHQLTLSPRRLRLRQISRIDELLGILDPDRAYPFDFVCYRITRYRKRRTPAGDSIPGKALISDLITLVETISRKANLSVAELGEPCCTYDELAKELKVSTKTLRRWRSRGLMGLRLVYQDGVNRLAFRRRTIDRFVESNKELVARGASFKQLTVAERERIVDRARQLIADGPIKLHAAATIIAEESGRAVETVRYTLRRHDDAHREAALFANKGKTVWCERYEGVWRCHENGESAKTIARAFACSQKEIHSILRQVQVGRWSEPPMSWVHNELFDAPNADQIILDGPEPTAQSQPTPRVPKGLPSYLESLYRTPLLSREQEQDLFRRYNFLKYRMDKVLKSIDPACVTKTEFQRAADLMSEIDAVRQRIVEANLRLVVSIAKKHVGWSPRFFETISDGNMSLMRAVEGFDYARGNKFSTYASWAIMKNYARSVPEEYYHASRYVTGQESVLEVAADRSTDSVSPADHQKVRELIAESLQKLDEREREIVSNHFGLSPDKEPMTLEQLGRRFGVTKERVRQIEKRALAQLKTVLAPSLMDTFAT